MINNVNFLSLKLIFGNKFRVFFIKLFIIFEDFKFFLTFALVFKIINRL